MSLNSGIVVMGITLLVVVLGVLSVSVEYDATHQHGLRTGREVAVSLTARRTKSMYFHLDDDAYPVWIRVTPCGGMVKWKITQQIGSDDPDDIIEGSGSGVEDDEEIYTPNDTLGNNRESHGKAATASSSTERSTSVSGDVNTNTENGTSTSKASSPHEVTLMREVGMSYMQYYSDDLPVGLYLLHLTALHNDTKVRVYYSSSGASNQFFPTLPRRPRLNLANVTKSDAHLSWDRSPSAGGLKGDNFVDYCMVLSRSKQFHTYCELEATLDTNSVGNQAFEGKAPGNSLYPEHRESSFEKSRKYSRYKSKYEKLQFACVQHKTAYHFGGLLPNTKYHLSLFAVNRHTGGSVAYEGVSFLTLKKAERSNEVVDLKDGQMMASYLNPSRKAFKQYRFPIKHFQKTVLVNILPCSGYLRVQIFENGKRLRRSTFENLKTFRLPNVKPGNLLIKVANDDHDAKIYKIWASVKPSKNPYPRLPIDTSIKVIEKLRRCNSVVLEWLVTHEEHEYCLYKREEEDDYFKTLILEESDQCRGPPAAMTKVFCKRFNLKKGGTMTMKETVPDLKKRTTYRFDLYASKPHRERMPYRTVWVKTKKDC